MIIDTGLVLRAQREAEGKRRNQQKEKGKTK